MLCRRFLEIRRCPRADLAHHHGRNITLAYADRLEGPWRIYHPGTLRRHEAAVVRLIGALLLEQNDDWATQRARYMTLETIAPMSDTALVRMPELAA